MLAQEAAEESLPCPRMQVLDPREHAVEVGEHRVGIARREHGDLAGTRNGPTICAAATGSRGGRGHGSRYLNVTVTGAAPGKPK
jgi:hypothetical protein